MKNQIEIVKEIADSMIGIGGVPSNEEFYNEFNIRIKTALNISDNPHCSCSKEEKTGETSIMCCNKCGKPTEKFWYSKNKTI